MLILQRWEHVSRPFELVRKLTRDRDYREQVSRRCRSMHQLVAVCQTKLPFDSAWIDWFMVPYSSLMLNVERSGCGLSRTATLLGSI